MPHLRCASARRKAHVALLCYYVTLLQQTHFCFGVQVGVTDVHRFPKGIAWQSLPTSLDLILLPLSPFISTKVKTDVRISFRSESSSLPSASHHHHHCHHHHHHCHHQHHHCHHHLSPVPASFSINSFQTCVEKILTQCEKILTSCNSVGLQCPSIEQNPFLIHKHFLGLGSLSDAVTVSVGFLEFASCLVDTLDTLDSLDSLSIQPNWIWDANASN